MLLLAGIDPSRHSDLKGVPMGGRFPHPLNIEKQFMNLDMMVVKSALLRSKQAGIEKQDTRNWLWVALQKCWSVATTSVTSLVQNSDKWLGAKLHELYGNDFEKHKLDRVSQPLWRLREAYDDVTLFDQTKIAATIFDEMLTLSKDPTVISSLKNFIVECTRVCWLLALSVASGWSDPQIIQSAKFWFT